MPAGPLGARRIGHVRFRRHTFERVEIYNSAWVMTSTYDENYENDYAFASVPADPSVTSDLWLKMAGPATTPLVGDTFDITITVGNDGPLAAGDVWVSDYLPGSLEFVSATPADRCSFNEAGPYPMAKGPETDAPKQSGDGCTIRSGGTVCSATSAPSAPARHRPSRSR